MEGVLSQMHVTLKQMQAKSAKSKTTDPLTKANLDMWELMVGHLDKELEQMRVVFAQREDMEVRRAALYKQADAKAEAEAQAAMAGKLAGQSAAAAAAGQAAPAASATPTPAALTPSGPAATPVPASPATSPNKQ
jgi:peptidoglycan hydrolase CwlO-like protein